MRKTILLLAVLSLALLALAGCGSEDEAASGASELVPAGAAFYGEATLKPEGDQKKAVEAILAKFPGGGQAGQKLKDLIEKGLRESEAPISFEEDIEPWLGDEAAFFASGVTASGSFRSGAALVATEDEDASVEALEKSAEGDLRRQDYKGTEILRDESDEAAAVIDGFLVLGSERGVKTVIDTAEDGSSLSESEEYETSIEDAADDRLGLLYVNSEQFARSIEESGVPLPDSAKRFFEEPTVATIDADDDGVTVEGSAPEDFARAGFLGEASDLLPELPADSWLALAQTDFGELVDFYLGFAGAVVGGRDALEQQFRAATGLDLEEDVLAWMGDFAIFARGTSTSELDGALIIETSDEAASGRFLEALERLSRTQSGGPFRVGPLALPGGGEGFTVTGTPKPIHSFQREGRVVLAYGDTAAEDAVSPSETLGDSADFGAVRDSLGDAEVSVYVLMQPIFDLVDSMEAGNSAAWQDAQPYLEPLSAIVSGTSGDGDDLRYLMKLIVK